MPPACVREQRVLRLSRCERTEVVREQALQALLRARTANLEAAHVRDVEDARATAHRAVLLDDAAVLHRHGPAGERHHARPEGHVSRVQRRLPQGLRHGA